MRDRWSVWSMLCVLGLASLTMTGCLGSRDWAYPPPPGHSYLGMSAAQPLPANLVVRPLEDRRGTTVRKEYWKLAVPLVPYTVTAYDRPEAVSSPEHVDEVRFDPPNDFARAVADEIQAANIFSSVTFAPDDQPASPGDFVLQGRLYSTRWERKLATYMLGPLGPALWLVGLPMGMSSINVAMDIQVTPAEDPSRVLWSFAMEFTMQELDALYYGLGESVRNYPQALQGALRLAVRDLMNNMPARARRF